MMEKEFECTVTVNAENTAKSVRSGSLNVFATPSLAALAERTACELLNGELEEGSTTVGTVLNIKHLAPTPIGLDVKCVCKLTEVDGRRFCFEMQLFDAGGKVGEVYHERFLVYSESFMKKALSRGKTSNEF